MKEILLKLLLNLKKLQLNLEKRLISYYRLKSDELTFLSELKVLLRLIYIITYIPRAFKQG